MVELHLRSPGFCLRSRVRVCRDKLKESERFKQLYAKDEAKIKQLNEEIIEAKKKKVYLWLCALCVYCNLLCYFMFGFVL